MNRGPATVTYTVTMFVPDVCRTHPKMDAAGCIGDMIDVLNEYGDSHLDGAEVLNIDVAKVEHE